MDGRPGRLENLPLRGGGAHGTKAKTGARAWPAGAGHTGWEAPPGQAIGADWRAAHGVELHLQWHDAADFDKVERLALRTLIDDVDGLYEEYGNQGDLSCRDDAMYTKTAWVLTGR
jgi:hypothetical protein